jgi:peptidyl-prolyl cis-trans isomerase D
MVLQSIREKLTGILAFGILGVLIIPFALVGVNEYFTTNSGNIVARVNDTEIAFNDFNESYSRFRRRAQATLGARFDPVQFDQLVMRRQHLDSMIDEELMSQAVQSLGLDIDDKTLAEEIYSIPAFQVDGQFNQDVYQSRLISQGLTPTQFQNEMRSQIVLSQLPENITVSSIATSSEISEFVALLDQSRTFNVAMVPAVIDEEIAFTEEEVNQWYESHSEDFQSEERVIIEYVELDAAFLPVGPPPEEDYLRDQFESQSARFISPEQRRASHILIEVSTDADEATKATAKQMAADLSKRALDGEDFAALATEFSQDVGSAAQGGDLGWVEPGVMVSAFETAVFELSMETPVSGPVETGFGWHVIQLTEVRESSGMSFEEARMQLLVEYEDEGSARAFLEQADRLVDLIYEDPTTLEGAALDLGLTVYEVGPFSRAGGEGIAATPAVVAEAFTDMVLLQDSVSDPVNLDENRLVMIKLKQHLPVALKPLQEVRVEISTILSENLANEKAKIAAEELLLALQAGENVMEVVAVEAGLEYARHETIKRNAVVPDSTLVREIFRLQAPVEGETVQIVLPTSLGYAAVELESVTDGVLDQGSLIAKQQYERVLANGNASKEAYALLRQLRSTADLEVFEDRIK